MTIKHPTSRLGVFLQLDSSAAVLTKTSPTLLLPLSDVVHTLMVVTAQSQRAIQQPTIIL
jgi:hypothetical protein